MTDEESKQGKFKAQKHPKITSFTFKDAKSVGDVMRSMDAKHCLVHDFVVITGKIQKIMRVGRWE